MIGATARPSTVLVCDDELALLNLVMHALESEDVKVLGSHDPREALRLAEGLPALDVLVTDVVMPHIPGPELAARVRAVHPGVRVVYMSGYSRDLLGDADDRALLLAKPFPLGALLAAVWPAG
jgi:CheY-like chemotaxis protein